MEANVLVCEIHRDVLVVQAVDADHAGGAKVCGLQHRRLQSVHAASAKGERVQHNGVHQGGAGGVVQAHRRA